MRTIPLRRNSRDPKVPLSLVELHWSKYLYIIHILFLANKRVVFHQWSVFQQPLEVLQHQRSGYTKCWKCKNLNYFVLLRFNLMCLMHLISAYTPAIWEVMKQKLLLIFKMGSRCEYKKNNFRFKRQYLWNEANLAVFSSNNVIPRSVSYTNKKIGGLSF